MNVPKTTSYFSDRLGDTVLIEWPDGVVSIVRRLGDGGECFNLSTETMDKIQELRGPLPGAELAT